MRRNGDRPLGLLFAIEDVVTDTADGVAVHGLVEMELGQCRLAHRLVIFEFVDVQKRRALEVAPHAPADVGLVAAMSGVGAVVQSKQTVSCNRFSTPSFGGCAATIISRL